MNHEKANLHPTSMIARNATIIGNVFVGENCTVLFNATLRGDSGGRIVVEEGTNIQENCCLHVNQDGITHVGKNATVGHGAILHGCTIGERTIVGMGAIIIDGAKVGSDCLIGAGSLVTGSANIPNGMLVLGSPAKAVRPLSKEEISALPQSAETYINTGKDLLDQGFLVSGASFYSN